MIVAIHLRAILQLVGIRKSTINWSDLYQVDGVNIRDIQDRL